MEEKEYKSGFERYQDIAEKIKQQCLNLKGETVNILGYDKTHYNWNGFDVFIADGEIEICDENGENTLSSHDTYCHLGLLDGFKFGVHYDSEPTNSWLTSQYQNISSTEKNSPPDNISIIIQKEIEEANKELKKIYIANPHLQYTLEGYDNVNEVNYNKAYLTRLHSALDFYEKLEELSKNEKAVEEHTENFLSSQQTGAEKILEFVNNNNLDSHDLSLALSMTLAKTTDKTNAEQHIVNEYDRSEEKTEDVRSEY